MSKITEFARGKECQIRLYMVCNHNTATSVWCHANGLSAGHGIGHKGPDLLGAIGCFDCHNVYDRRVPTPKHLTRQDVEIAFHQAHQRSLVMLIEAGVI